MTPRRRMARGLAIVAASLALGLVPGGCSDNGASAGSNDGGDAGLEGAVIEGGDAPPVCTMGQEPCGQTCVDLASDSNDCGACGNACPTEHFCKGATCVTCADGNRTSCNGVCADLLSDPAHCGNCSTSCPNGTMCDSGACVETCAASKS